MPLFFSLKRQNVVELLIGRLHLYFDSNFPSMMMGLGSAMMDLLSAFFSKRFLTLSSIFSFTFVVEEKIKTRRRKKRQPARNNLRKSWWRRAITLFSQLNCSQGGGTLLTRRGSSRKKKTQNNKKLTKYR